MKKYLLLSWLIAFLLVSLLESCGARKTETTKKEEVTKTGFSGFSMNSENSEELLNTDLNLKVSDFTKIDNENVSATNEFTIEPSDPTKPASYIDPKGQKHVLDNAKMTNKKSSNLNSTKSEKSENSEEKRNSQQSKKADQNIESNVKITSENKTLDAKRTSDREQWSLWNLLWLLIPVAFWKIYKKVNPIS